MLIRLTFFKIGKTAQTTIVTEFDAIQITKHHFPSAALLYFNCTSEVQNVSPSLFCTYTQKGSQYIIAMPNSHNSPPAHVITS